MFALVVGNFVVEHTGKENAKNLTDTLNLHCEIAEEWKCEKHLAIDLNWNYEKRNVRLLMKNYTKELWMRFNHTKPNEPCNSPPANITPTCGTKVQHADAPD